jgi:glutathione S-transferase
MTILLYDLAGADPELRFSPYCWRIKFALAHKGLPVQTTPWFFTDEQKLAFSGQAKVPVIVDGDRTIADSWAIAGYLDEQYPDRPSLFGGAAGLAHARFLNAWADSILQPAMARLVVRDILDVLRPQDQPYFRHSRERAFGMKLEDVVKGREHGVQEFRKLLAPLRLVLRGQPWLGGAAPDYADYIVLGSFMWPRCASSFQLLESDDPVCAWRERGLALFGGLGEKARLAA